MINKLCRMRDKFILEYEFSYYKKLAITKPSVLEISYNPNRYILIDNTGYLRERDIIISGMQLVQFDFPDGSIEYKPGIIVDKLFNKLPEYIKCFFIEHEMGHFENDFDSLFNSSLVRNLESEFRADEYAADKIGLEIAIDALNYLKDTFYDTVMDIEEIKTRIENLKNLNKNIGGN